MIASSFNADSVPRGASRGPPVLSIVMASLNERENLPHLFDRIDKQSLPPYEIIVVDDGSTDGTRRFLEERSREDSRIRPIFHEGPQTLIPAHCQGIKAASGEFVIIMDADLQHPPETLPAMVRQLQRGTGLVVASRYMEGGSPGSRSFVRVAVSTGALLAAKFFVSHADRTSDPISGFYGFRRSVFVPVDPRWRGYELLPFVLAMCRHLSLVEIPYTFRPRRSGLSKIVSRDLRFIQTYLVELVLAARFNRLLAAGMVLPGSATGSGVASPSSAAVGAVAGPNLMRR
jgi:dolichol-phosphate mannosyltransferase